MKKILFFIAIFFPIITNAQNYQISFAGTGESTIVNSVKIENLTTGASLILNGSDILRLTVVTGLDLVKNRQTSELKIFPNPITGNATLQIQPSEAGNAVINIIDITGKQVAHFQGYLENNLQEFRLSGLMSGLYLISVRGSNYQYSAKLLCSDKEGGIVRIEKISNNLSRVEKIFKNDLKGTLATIDMAYSIGERIKFTGTSGSFSTVKTDIPSGDKTITFDFIACTDGDGNNYPVVIIGAQTWMAENLKTTKFKDGNTSISNIVGNSEWVNLTTPAYCWYNNEVAYKTIYGALYNWFTVNTGNLCPTGWHVPTEAEWTTLLATYLGGESEAGGKLKETGTAHWVSPNTGAIDETGFTALPGAVRSSGAGGFYYLGIVGYWWSSEEYDATNAWFRYMRNNYINVAKNNDSKKNGISVRCLMN